MDNWIEVNVAVTHEAVEAVSEVLTEAGSKGVAIEDPQLINDLRNSGTWELCDIPEQQNTEVVTVSGYYADDEKLQERLAQIEAELEAIEERIGQYRFGNTRKQEHLAQGGADAGRTRSSQSAGMQVGECGSSGWCGEERAVLLVHHWHHRVQHSVG